MSILKLISSFTVVFIFTTAATVLSAQPTTDYDKTVDFSKYTSFYFAGWEKNSGTLLTDFNQQRVISDLTAEMASRGIAQADKDKASMAITGYVVADQKTSTTAYTTFNGGLGYGAGWGWGMGAGMAGATTTYDTDDYTEGTLVIDIYDASSKKLIYQGVDQEVIATKADKREKQISKMISKLMKEYPVAPTKN